MIKISACIITFNEADRIEACIKSLSFCDEIIVVDSGSSDATVALAESLGAKVSYRKFEGFRTQKQFAVEQASFDWILSLDADEIVTEKLRQQIIALQHLGLDSYSGYKFPRCLFYHNKFLRHGNAYPNRILRLFNKTQAGWHGDKEIHERVVNRGKTGSLSGDLEHYAYRGFSHELQKRRQYALMMADFRNQQHKKASFIKLFVSPVLHFVRGYFFRLGFLDGWQGLVFQLNKSHYSMQKELYLMDLQRNQA
ncbi:MAG: glycosyltransferase family 2 protein [Arenimonas sp.]|nr:glycosyltransferase family 2 protein [Arenimonas sp.]